MVINSEMNGRSGPAKVNGQHEHNASTNGDLAMSGIQDNFQGKVAYRTQPIALVGMGCRFPGHATTPEKLWRLVSQGQSAWSEIPADRFKKDTFYHDRKSNSTTMDVKGAHFLDQDVAEFDASFFNFSAETANSMDPQLRMQLEIVFEAFESAGIPLPKLVGSDTSVFASVFLKDYSDALIRDPDMIPKFWITGNGSAMLSNRVSHFFDLRGLSTTIDTGCSTALTALHLACQAIRAGESKIAIVSGTNLLLNPDAFISMRNLGFLGPDGKCYAFDSRAEGYGRGEGAAAIILKPLADAIRDGDPIRAVIRETALNQDGKTPTITSPSRDAQEDLIRLCYERAGLNPLDTDYVEAHGTGTRTGDLIEASSIGTVLGRGRPAHSPLRIGTVKSNIGHLEAASGLASLIKVALAFENSCIPPSINFEQPNPEINFKELGVKVATQLELWPRGSMKRASINNFGYGGANAHIILDDPKLHLPGSHDGQSSGPTPVLDRYVFIVSAKDSRGVRAAIDNLAAYLQSEVDNGRRVDLAALAYTLSHRRTRFEWSVAVTAASEKELVEALLEKGHKTSSSTERPRLGFVFNGQGAQWYAMGRELLQVYPVFAQCLQQADQYMTDLGADWSLIAELTRDRTISRVNKVEFSFPLSCAIQVALVVLLADWGITPAAVTSHSSGEVAAAFAAGLISLREAITISTSRGKLTASLVAAAEVPGGMLAVGLSPDVAASHLASLSSGKAVIACVNSSASVTLSGDIQAIEELESRLVAKGVFTRRLKVEGAYHSHHMLPLVEEYRSILLHRLDQSRQLGNVLYSSPVTGGRITSASEINAEHWVKNMVQPVLFCDALKAICTGEAGVDTIVEVGPHGTLAGPVRQCLQDGDLKGHTVGYTSCLTRDKDAVETIQLVACTLLEHGYVVDLAKVNSYSGAPHPRVMQDLPSYPWNHSTKFWTEPRLNEEHRQRKHAPHDLVGLLNISNNPFAPTWRHHIRVREIPWVSEHMVQSDIVYPGAGSIAMAIEAVRQLHEAEGKLIAGFLLRDIEITQAIVIPQDGESIEVQLSLQPADNTHLVQGWQKFHVCSITEGQWREHCRGLVSVQHQQHIALTSIGTDHIDDGDSIDTESFFERLRSLGVNHGPIFRNLASIRRGQDRALATVKIPDIAAVMPGNAQSEHVIHPITLDAVFQVAYAALSSTAAEQVGAAIPRSFKRMYVGRNVNSKPGHRFEARSRLESHHKGGFQVDMSLHDAEADEAVLEVEGGFFQAVGAGARPDPKLSMAKLCQTVEWNESLSLAAPEQLQQALAMAAGPDEVQMVAELDRATYHIVRDTLDELTEQDRHGLSEHHKKLVGWMQQYVVKAAANELDAKSARWQRASRAVRRMLLDKVASASVNGELLIRVGESLVRILRRETSPLELILEGNLLHRFYEKTFRLERTWTQVEKLVTLFAHENPRATILEIGGGTGACTMPVLGALSGADASYDPRFSRYDFTDISTSFFEAAKDRFGGLGEFVTFRQLDIEQDPAKQSFEPGSYDLVVACNVLHATRDINATMRNVRKLLKDGGKLLLVESTEDTAEVQLIFGTLPGWWLSKEDNRQSSPNMSVDTWAAVLEHTGFTGVDMEVRNCEDERIGTQSVMLSTARAGRAAVAHFHPQTALVYAGRPPPAAWTDGLTADIEHVTGSRPAVECLDGAFDATDKVCIFVGEMEQPVLSRMDGAAFAAVQSFVCRARGLLWVTRGGAMKCEHPELAMHSGLLRTRRQEDAGGRYITLDVDPHREPWTEASAQAIMRVFTATLDYAIDPAAADVEFAERASALHVARAHPDKALNDALLPNQDGAEWERVLFDQPERPLRVALGRGASLDTLLFVDDDQAHEALPADAVELRPHAFGLNFRDVLVAMGEMTGYAGNDCSGTVTAVGAAAQAQGLRVGDRACAVLPRGTWASRVRAPAACVARVPDGLTLDTAAALPTVFVTAFHALVDVARLGPGETVLIHAAAGGVGQAAVALAQHAGARVLATAGTPEKRAFLAAHCGVAPDCIFSSRDLSFGAAVRQATADRGVDVVLNSLAGAMLEESWRCLAPLGRFVEIGKRDLIANRRLEMEPFLRALTYACVDILTLAEHRPAAVARALREVLPLLASGAIRAIEPVTAYALSDAEKAFRLMQSGKHLGKLIIRATLGSTVKAPPRRAPPKLSSQASYLVVGGLGGIGRSIARLLVSHGARHLILMSRHASSSRHARAVAELQANGCSVQVKDCDIADASSLECALRECAAAAPPVRGVIQGAMLLKDSIFERMTFDQWLQASGPKVQGTMNLHNQLGGSVDFFISLSSTTGLLGNPSQANYAAGGTFQDALGRSRASMNLPAVTIDLGMVEGVGYVSKRRDVAERLQRNGYRPITEAEVHALVEAAISHPRRPPDVDGVARGAQVITSFLPFTDPGGVAWRHDRRFIGLRENLALTGRRGADAAVNGVRRQDDLKLLLSRASSGEEAARVLTETITTKLSEMFMLPVEEIDENQPLVKYGVDSLVAVELRNWLVRATGVDFSIFDILQSSSLVRLAHTIAKKVAVR